MLKAVLIQQMRERGAPALRVPDPYGINRWILSAKRLNLEVLDIRPDFPQSVEFIEGSDFHLVLSILSDSGFSDLFYHNFITLMLSRFSKARKSASLVSVEFFFRLKSEIEAG
jgi:hypothetical protein